MLGLLGVREGGLHVVLMGGGGWGGVGLGGGVVAERAERFIHPPAQPEFDHIESGIIRDFLIVSLKPTSCRFTRAALVNATNN